MRLLPISFILVPAAVLLSACAGSSPDPGVPSSMLDEQWASGLPLAVGKTKLKLPSEIPGEVDLAVQRLRPDLVDHGGPLSSGEDQDGLWRTYLASMQVNVKGQTIDFPKAMVTPLNEPHWLRLQIDGKKLYIIIDGLDGAASYRTIFTVDNGLITQRLVAQSEFPNQIWERTIYHDEFDEHPERDNR
jgi:hypothetical protein